MYLINIIVGSSVVFDMYSGKVPNRLMLTAYLLAPLFMYLDYGGMGILSHLLPALGAGVILFFCYMVNAIGAGDVKLMTFICLFLDSGNIFRFLILVFGIGAVLGVIKVACNIIENRTELSSMRIKFTVPITIGYMIIVLWGG